MMKLIRVSLTLRILASTNGEAQTLLAPTQHVNMRKGPSAKNAVISVLAPSDTVTMLAPDSLRRGFYHVVTAKPDTGWASRSYMKHVAGAAPPKTTVATNAAAATTGVDHPAAAFSPDWPKTDPNHADMPNAINPAQVCHFGGTPAPPQPTVNTLQNRSDTPAEYHSVTWDALAHLAWPKEAVTHRDPDPHGAAGWTAAENAVLAPDERQAITATG